MTSTRHLALGLCSLALCLAAAGPLAAAGAESLPVPAEPELSPEQIAVNEYNAGIDLRDKALEADEKALATTDARKRGKLEEKRADLFTKAVARFEAAVAGKPDFHQAHGSLGYALRRLGRYEEAMKAYDEALRLNPNYPEATEYRAEALLGLGRVAEAQEAYERLAILSPSHAAQLLAAFESYVAGSGAADAGGGLAEWIEQRQSAASTTSPSASADPGSWR